jgi:hypothetical protein
MRRVASVARTATTIGGAVDTVLDYWTITIFLPAILVGLGILVAVVRASDK